MRLVMLGPPAAGKGTQGKLLAERYVVPHISTGSMFRASILSGSEVGRLAQELIERGQLVPDALAIEIVKERITEPDCQNGFVLDGFPRTVPQAESLSAALDSFSMELDAVINIQIPALESIARISNRRVCGQCGATTRVGVAGEVCPDCGGPLVQRPDDTPDTARNRLKVYLAQTEPVVEFYGKCGCLLTVDGLQPVDVVFAQILARLAETSANREQHTGRGGVAR